MDLSEIESDEVSVVDPNVLRNRLLEAAQETLKALNDPATEDDVTANENVLAEAWLQLDDWLCRGGFVPGAWQDTD